MSLPSAILLDGEPTTGLPLPDRGLDFGDGLFETLLIHVGTPLFIDLHLERLALGLRALAFPDCLSAARQQITDAATISAQQNWPWAVLRLSVIRGYGARGYAPPDDAKPRIVIYITQLDRDCRKMLRPASVSIAEIRLSKQPLLAHIKHLNRLEQVLAAAQANADGVDECIVLDQANQPTCVVAGNLFLVHQGELLTPKLVDCGILGTRRKLIIERWAPQIGLKVREVTMTLHDLQTADEVFYSNSLQTVRSVDSLGAQRWNSYSVCEEIFCKYLDELP